MRYSPTAMRIAFAVCLFASQFTAARQTFFSDNPWLLWVGVALIAGGIALWLAASMHLRRAQRSDALAVSGPFGRIRHPIYVSAYLICAGLGLVFFAWAWFLVLVAFVPLWWHESVTEERELVARFGAEYEGYRARTSMFIPGLF